MITFDALTLELVNETFPEHSRLSCGDENLLNWHRNEHGYPRCNRCYLLRNLGKSSKEIPMMIVQYTELQPIHRTIEVDEIVPD